MEVHMALSIVAQAVEAHGIERSTTCRYDVFVGTAEVLCAAGLISLVQLQSQKGRQPGHTAFLPSGAPCPPHTRAWREPGYKSIRHQGDGTYRVEVAVSKDVYAWRRSLEKAEKHEEEQRRINEEVAEHGYKYRDWVLKQRFEGWAEEWKGTKAQLQAAGLGVGMAFPGELGAASVLRCKCPLGFDFEVSSSYERAETAAGIFIARSRYVQAGRAPSRFDFYAPGVEKKVWTDESYDTRSDYYKGTAESLVLAGLVPHIGLFPGQAGANKMRATYQKNWLRSTSANGQSWGATIVKNGKSGSFTVEVPVEPAEANRRKDLHTAYQEKVSKEEQRISEERRLLRQGLAAVETKSVEQFRFERAKLAEVYLKLAWSEIFGKTEGALGFDLPEDGEHLVALAEAFQAIRNVAKHAPVRVDERAVNEARGRVRLVAARNDASLQSLLRKVGHLRLVGPPDDKTEQES
jgi:hypothetical protein